MEVYPITDSRDKSCLVESLHLVISRVEGSIIQVHPVSDVLQIYLYTMCCLLSVEFQISTRIYSKIVGELLGKILPLHVLRSASYYGGSSVNRRFSLATTIQYLRIHSNDGLTATFDIEFFTTDHI